MATKRFGALAFGLMVAGCATISTRVAGEDAIVRALAADIRTLASDEFDGRAPGTQGERLTTDYLIDRMQAAGLEPGTPEGWRQPVRLLRVEGAEAALSLAPGPAPSRPGVKGARATAPDDAAASFPDVAPIAGEGTVAARRVFVVHNPAHLPANLRDTLVIVPDYETLGTVLPAARESGAGAFLVFADDDRAPTLEGRESGRWHLPGELAAEPIVAMLPRSHAEAVGRRLGAGPGWLTREGRLAAHATLRVTRRIRAMVTDNIVGRLPGRVPGSGAVLLLAHWDHLGECGAPARGTAAGPSDPGPSDPAPPGPGPSDPALSDDTGASGIAARNNRICNGAVDNASGLAAILETTRRVAARGPLDRDLYVLATTGEEYGMLGATAFADDPPVPLPIIVAAFNIDMPAIGAARSDVAIVGQGRTPLDAGIAQVARGMGLGIERGDGHADMLQRQDGWALLERDVPAVQVTGSYGDRRAFPAFMAQRYHRPQDEWRADLDLTGAAQEVALHTALLRYFGSVTAYPVGEPPVAAPAIPASPPKSMLQSKPRRQPAPARPG